MSKVGWDVETTSIKKSDGRTKENNVDILMCTFGEEVTVGDTKEVHMKTMWADGYDDVPNLIQKITDQFATYRPMKLITYNGHGFDLPVYRRNYMDYNISGSPFRDADHVDVYKDMVQYNVYFDTKAGSKSLKTLSEKWLGNKYTMDGKMFFTLFEEWTKNGDDELLFDLIQYNQDDVRNTMEIYNRLANVTPKYYLRGKSL